MIRVAVAAPTRTRCGVTDYARRLAAALPERFDVSTIAFPDSAPSSSEASVPAAAWRRAASEADGADIVHVHYEYGLFGTVKPYRNRFATFMRRLRPPAVVSLHDLLPRLAQRWSERPPYGPREALRDAVYLPFFGRWDRTHYSLASHWIVHIRAHERAVAAVVGGERVTRWVLPNLSTNVRWHEPVSSAESARLVSLGFVKPHKGYTRFLDVLAYLPGVTWTVAGGAQDERDRLYLDRFSSELERLDLTGRVEVTGYLPRPELEALAVGSTLAVFPFDRVTGSASVAWAIALGMPVVASDLEEVRELAAEGAGIELLPLADSGSWPDRIARLLASPERLGALAAANRAFAESHSYKRAGERLGYLLEDVLARELGPNGAHRERR